MKNSFQNLIPQPPTIIYYTLLTIPGPLPKRKHLLSQRQAILKEKRGKSELKNLRRKIEKNEIATNAVALFSKAGNETKFKRILKRHMSAGEDR